MKYLKRFLAEFKFTFESGMAIQPIPVPLVMLIPSTVAGMILLDYAPADAGIAFLLFGGVCIYATVFLSAVMIVTIMDLL